MTTRRLSLSHGCKRSALAKTLFPAAILALAATGCGDDDTTADTPDAAVGVDAPVVEQASLRVIHASPDAPAVDIYAQGVATPLIEDLAYGTSSDYIDVDAGSYTIEVRAAGADASSDAVYTTEALSLGEGDTVTAVAAGLLGSTDAADAFRVLALGEGFDAAGTGKAIVRIVHASADAPSVAIDVGNDGSPELTDVARFAESGATGVELDADSALQIGIWAGDPLARVTAFTTPELEEGSELFIIAVGLLSSRPYADDGFGLLAVGAAGEIGIIRQNPFVYALHASPDAPAVDICAGSSALSENVEYGQLSAAIQVPPANYDLNFHGYDASVDACSNDPANASPFATGDLAAGGIYLAIAAGELSPEKTDADAEQSFGLLAVGVDWDRPEDGKAIVAVAHASGDAPSPVDVGTLDAGNIVDPAQFAGVAYGARSDAVKLDPETYTLGVGGAGTAPAASFDVPVAAGDEVIAVAAGAFDADADEEGFRLYVVDTNGWGVPTAINPD